jgi:hypothetical protein
MDHIWQLPDLCKSNTSSVIHRVFDDFMIAIASTTSTRCRLRPNRWITWTIKLNFECGLATQLPVLSSYHIHILLWGMRDGHLWLLLCSSWLTLVIDSETPVNVSPTANQITHRCKTTWQPLQLWQSMKTAITRLTRGVYNVSQLSAIRYAKSSQPPSSRQALPTYPWDYDSANLSPTSSISSCKTTRLDPCTGKDCKLWSCWLNGRVIPQTGQISYTRTTADGFAATSLNSELGQCSFKSRIKQEL